MLISFYQLPYKNLELWEQAWPYRVLQNINTQNVKTERKEKTNGVFKHEVKQKDGEYKVLQKKWNPVCMVGMVYICLSTSGSYSGSSFTGAVIWEITWNLQEVGPNNGRL